MILHSRTITPGPTRLPGVGPAASPRLKLSRCPGSISADVARYESVAPGLQFAYLSGVDATLNTARQPDMSFVTRALNPTPDEMAPDGSEVRLLARATAGSAWSSAAVRTARAAMAVASRAGGAGGGGGGGGGASRVAMTFASARATASRRRTREAAPAAQTRATSGSTLTRAISS